MAWQLHRLSMAPAPGETSAVEPESVYPQGYTPGLANWATLTTHIGADDGKGGANRCRFELGPIQQALPQGIYVNVEQPDEPYLENRHLWSDDKTWLYQQSDINRAELKEEGCTPPEPVGPVIIMTPLGM